MNLNLEGLESIVKALVALQPYILSIVIIWGVWHFGRRLNGLEYQFNAMVLNYQKTMNKFDEIIVPRGELEARKEDVYGRIQGLDNRVNRLERR